jgi:transposase
VVNTGAFLYAKTEVGKTRTTSTRSSGAVEWRVVDIANRSTVERFAEALSAVPNLSPLVSAVAAGRHFDKSITGLGGGFAGSRQGGFAGELHRWLLRGGEKGGSGVGKTKRGKGTKIMAIADRHGLPIGISVASASPHETQLIETTLEQRFTKKVPPLLIGDKAYDSDPLDEKLKKKYRVELVAPHKENRSKPRTQDGRRLRRYKRRWKVERLFAWLQNFRRLTTRWEHHLSNFLGMVHLGCTAILLRYF